MNLLTLSFYLFLSIVSLWETTHANTCLYEGTLFLPTRHQNSIYPLESISTKYPRTGIKLPEHKKGLYEVEISALTILPFREGPQLDSEILKKEIQKNGYHLGFPITFIIMPNGDLLVIRGENSIRAMSELGEQTIPGRVAIWSRFDLSTQNALQEKLFERVDSMISDELRSKMNEVTAVLERGGTPSADDRHALEQYHQAWLERENTRREIQTMLEIDQRLLLQASDRPTQWEQMRAPILRKRAEAEKEAILQELERLAASQRP